MKNYREMVLVFENIMMGHRNNSQKGRDEMMEAAMKRIREVEA